MDCGDYVVVSNARRVKVTGKKAQQIVYRHHTMFPGGLKEIPYNQMMDKKPDEVRQLHFFVTLIAHVGIDHSASGLGHAPKEQVEGSPIRTAANIRG